MALQTPHLNELNKEVWSRVCCFKVKDFVKTFRTRNCAKDTTCISSLNSHRNSLKYEWSWAFFTSCFSYFPSNRRSQFQLARMSSSQLGLYILISFRAAGVFHDFYQWDAIWMQGGMFKEHWPGGLLCQSRWRRKKRKKITKTSEAAQHSTIKK